MSMSKNQKKINSAARQKATCPEGVSTLMWIAKARTKLMLKKPFHGSVALGSEMIENSQIQTMATDGANIFYNDKFVRSLTLPEVAGVIAHECDHIVLLHVPRMGNRKPVKWNFATDYTINEGIRSELEIGVMELPEGVLLNEKYVNWAAEKIYNDLKDEDVPEDAEDHLISGKDLSPSEIKEMEGKAIRRAIAAGETAKAQGKLPARYKDLVEACRDVQIDWKELLPRQMIGDTPDDSTWRRPNRKFISQGFYLPSVLRVGVGNIYIWRDTSGSVSKSEQSACLGVVANVVEDIKPSCVFDIESDMQIGKIREYYEGDSMEDLLEVGGGGGTDPNAFLKYVEEHGVDVQAIICLTDMEFNYARLHDPGYDVTWVSTTRAKQPPFGTLIIMENI